jgi:dTDP-glucose 4,6-dehydratase
VLEAGRLGETYNIGGNAERTNLQIVHAICAALDDLRPGAKPYASLITHVPDRPGHDRRYAINANKILQELGWQPSITAEAGLGQTVEWYLENQAWVDGVRTGAYRQWIDQNYGARGAA